MTVPYLSSYIAYFRGANQHKTSLGQSRTSYVSIILRNKDKITQHKNTNHTENIRKE